MLASEYIKRIQDLIEVAGDVEIIIERPDGLYELAQAETQKVVPYKIIEYDENKEVFNPDYITGDKNVINLIRVW